MKAIKGNIQLFAEGRRAEQARQLDDAASAYQKVVDNDPGNKEAVGRLLMIYRRLKEYKKELAVIHAALGAVAQRDKEAQNKWIAAHPEAAKLGKAVLRKLGGQSVTAYGTDPLVEKLLKRKILVEKKIDGGTQTKVPAKKKKIQKAQKPASAASDKSVRRQEAEKKKEAAAELRRAGIAARKAAREKKVQAREADAQRRRAEKEARTRAEKEARAHPSLFIVSLRYLAPLERIDAAMAKHVAFLDKHFVSGQFLVSGRQVPRTGGIILARGKDRGGVERIMKQDPFVKGKLASIDIVEFTASKMGRGLEERLRKGI